MVDFTKNKAWAASQVIEDNADAGNIGKDVQADSSTVDFDSKIESGFFFGTSALGPVSTNYGISVMASVGTQGLQLVARDSIYSIRSAVANTFDELYHTGNTGDASYGGGLDITPTAPKLRLSPSSGMSASGMSSEDTGTTLSTRAAFINDNGLIGTISVNGTATAYNTSSDPRLKDFAEAPTDSAINTEFDNLFSCFRTFNWKNDPTGDLVWGFDAHECIDKNTGIGSEGEGPRGMGLTEVYATTPEVVEYTETEITDEEGNPTGEYETVVVKEAIEHKVSPAGVDQSKAVPILLAKIEQLERRLSAAGL